MQPPSTFRMGGINMTKDKLYHISFQLILHSGNARSSAMEAMTKAREGTMEEAEKKITEANSELNKGHQIQTDLIQKEADGADLGMSLITVHAQDHLMNAMTIRDLAQEIIFLHQKRHS